MPNFQGNSAQKWSPRNGEIIQIVSIEQYCIFEFNDTKNIGIDVIFIKIGPLLRKLRVKISQFWVTGGRELAHHRAPGGPRSKIFSQKDVKQYFRQLDTDPEHSKTY